MNPSPLKSPLALARSPAAGSVCAAGPAGSVCREVDHRDCRVVARSGVDRHAVVMATVAVATTSPGCVLLPATAIVALFLLGAGPPVQATVVESGLRGRHCSPVWAWLRKRLRP